MSSPIPVNLIAGPLGVGKTTTINHLLSQRPAHERWAVLVNEYGLVGLDAALLDRAETPREPDGVEIREIAGGCICCSAGFMFEVSLVLLLQRRPDRLLIEPTGIAALSGILDTLDRPGIRESVDLRSVVCLLDPSRLYEDLERRELQDQIEAADVLVANRCDLASQDALAQFFTWANAHFPPKARVSSIANGELSLRVLDIIADRNTPVPRGGHPHGTDHHHHDLHDLHDLPQLRADIEAAREADREAIAELQCDESRPFIQRSHRASQGSTFGWICWNALIFDAERISCWLSQLARRPGARRTKAVMRTNEGWWAFNFVNGEELVRPSGHRRDSRISLIIDDEHAPDPADLEASLRACLVRDEHGDVSAP